VFVDEAFTELVKEMFGYARWTRMPAATQHRFLHDEWENGIKSTFDGRQKTWKLTIPYECLGPTSLTVGTPLPKITLTEQHVRDVFDPVIDKIGVMVDEQIAAVRASRGKNPKVKHLCNPVPPPGLKRN
jgi:hypothetical protein